LEKHSLVFVSVLDIFGGKLDDITNLKLQVCTTFVSRNLKTSEKELGGESGGEPLSLGGGRQIQIDRPEFGSSFNEDCNTQEEEEETVY